MAARLLSFQPCSRPATRGPLDVLAAVERKHLPGHRGECENGYDAVGDAFGAGAVHDLLMEFGVIEDEETAIKKLQAAGQ